MLLSRRRLLKSIGAISTACALPTVGSSLLKAKKSKAVNYKFLFNQALAKNPALIGFGNIEENFSLKKMELEGVLPQDLTGSLIRNGPAKMERGDVRYHHMFEGDGMIQQFRFGNGQITHHGRFVNTKKYAQEEKAQKFLFSGPDTHIENSLAVTINDTVNTANTNVIPVGDDLWALWEAGSPTRIDEKTLDNKGIVNLGDNSKYGTSLKGLPFSAHPKIDANGDIFNFGLHASGQVVVYHLSSTGNMKNVALIDAKYRGGMLHDFLITHRHILLVLPSLTVNTLKQGYFEQMEFNSEQPMVVLMVDKNTLKVTKRYELPPGFVFHFGNAWEENDGTIHFDASLYENADVINELSRIMVGDSHHPKESSTTLVTLKPNGTTHLHTFSGNSEFPRIAPHLTGLRNDYLYSLSRNPGGLWRDRVNRLNVNTGKQDTYHYGSEFLVEEHLPVCPQGKEKQGYLVGTALHVPTKRTCINVFDVTNLSAGPISRGWLPYHLPLGFHGNFKPT
jgi:carotenoid cleavage dioxygenase-like enzyme